MPAFDIKEFQTKSLELHNELRKEHGAPPLVMSEDLAKGAKIWAKELTIKNTLVHEEGLKNISENIMKFSGHEPSAEFIFNYWAEEKKYYDFKTAEFQEKAAHFTQMIWVNSVEFGIDFEISKDNEIVVVARYSPCGNYKGLFSRNVYESGCPMAERSKQPNVPLSKLPDAALIEKYFTAVHNIVREVHDSPLVKWDKELSVKASEAARKILEFMERNEPTPDTDPNYGRNMIVSVGGIPPLQDICSLWYEGSLKYNYDNYTYQPECGSFSQMIWYDSCRLGAGIAEQNNKCCCVCYYDPPGNVTGGYMRNVSKPLPTKLIDINFEKLMKEISS